MRVVAAVVAVVLGCGAAMAGVVPDVAAAAPAPASVTVSLAETAFDAPLPAGLAADAALPAPVGTPPAPVTLPLPPGVVVGLIGLASAAIARRRYLKRH